MIDYTCINTRKSIPREKLNHCQRPKTWWTWRVISIIAENKPLAHHKTHLHTMKVYNARPVYSLSIEVFTEVFTCSKVINALISCKRKNSWPDRYRKSSTSFAPIFPKLTSQNEAIRCGTSRFLSPVSAISARNARDHDPLLARTREKKKTEKETQYIFRVSQQT